MALVPSSLLHTQCDQHPLNLESSSYARTSSLSFSPSSSSSSSSPSIYVTFKVLQLVKRIQRRVHTRPRSSSTTSSKVKPAKARRQAFCQDLEQLAAEEIDRYLGRKTIYPPQFRSRSDRSIEWLLNEIDHSLTNSDHKLDVIAKDNQLFLDRSFDLKIKHLKLEQLIELLINVKDLLATLRERLPESRVRSICEGNEIFGSDLEETYIANLEHLLLCLQSQLVREIVAHYVGLVHHYLVEPQKKQQKRCVGKFSGFPNSRRPLSTTWPWSIRPSLAVIWGVCWMFFDSGVYIDSHGRMIDAQGNIVFTAQQVREISAGMNSSPTGPGSDHMQPSRRLSHSGGNGRARARQPNNPDSSGQIMPSFPSQLRHSLSHTQSGHVGHPHQVHIRQQQAAQLGPIQRGLEVHNHHSASPAAPPPGYVTQNSGPIITSSVGQDWHLHAVATQAETSRAYYDNASPTTPYNSAGYYAGSTEDIWPEQQQQNQQLRSHSSAPAYPQTGFDSAQPALPRQRPLTPSIRLTTEVPGSDVFQHTPQDTTYQSGISSASSGFYEDRSQFPLFQQQHLGTQGSPGNMTSLPEMLAVQQSLGVNDGMQQHVPVSPISAHDASPSNNIQHMGEALSRKRSHSQMSHDGPYHNTDHHQRMEASPGAPPLDAADSGQDEVSPRGSHSFKRGDPPMNQANKYICDFSTECEGQTFDRKCEWSKHMDKHDRPYRCQHPDCGKLQGFTYSGGLLRHEREVHGKHGGPKSQLMCPFEDCKRHTGKGFTRKENLNEHVRRVHDSKYMGGTTAGAPAPPAQAPLPPGFEQLADAAPAARMSDATPAFDEMLGDALRKRKHSAEMDDVEEIKQEMKRLREDNESKAERMRIMEAQEAHRMLEMEQLRAQIREMQQGGGLQQQIQQMQPEQEVAKYE